MVRYPAESEGYWHLKEETNGSHGIADKVAKAEASDKGWCVGIEGSLRTVIAQGDQEVDPDAPVSVL